MVQKIITTIPTHATQEIETPTKDPQQYPTKKAVFHTYNLLWYLLAVVELLLLFRFVLKFIGANTASGFTQFIYAASTPFYVPFAGIITTNSSGGSIFEWPVLVAMTVYAVIVWLIVELLLLIKPVDPVEVEKTLENA